VKQPSRGFWHARTDVAAGDACLCRQCCASSRPNPKT
jgi:hypothetical protein